MCYGKNYLLHGVSLEGQSLVRVLRTAALYLSHGRATLLPASCCRCQKHLCKVVMQSCHLQEAQNGPTQSVLPCSHLCSERGESAASEKEEGQEQKVLDVLELGHIMARQLVQLVGPFMQLRAFQRCHAVVQCQESIRPKAGSCFCHLLAMDLRRSQLASLSLHLLAYKIGTLIGICIVLYGISEIKYILHIKQKFNTVILYFFHMDSCNTWHLCIKQFRIHSLGLPSINKAKISLILVYRTSTFYSVFFFQNIHSLLLLTNELSLEQI